MRLENKIVDNIDYQQIMNIQYKINNRPRKILNFENPKNNFFL